MVRQTGLWIGARRNLSSRPQPCGLPERLSDTPRLEALRLCCTTSATRKILVPILLSDTLPFSVPLFSKLDEGGGFLIF